MRMKMRQPAVRSFNGTLNSLSWITKMQRVNEKYEIPKDRIVAFDVWQKFNTLIKKFRDIYLQNL